MKQKFSINKTKKYYGGKIFKKNQSIDKLYLPSNSVAADMLL